MANVHAHFIDYDRHYYRMIGEWDITPEEAYKTYYNFLKDFKFIGTFHYYMNKEFGSYSQLYKQYFIERVSNYQHYCNYNNSLHATFNERGATLYPWYNDIVLLFPFAYNNKDTYDEHGCIQYNKIHYIRELWKMYCSEHKITHSIIQINNETMADNSRRAFSTILEGCGFEI